MTEKVELTVIDGEGLVMGRLASRAAKLLLLGETVIIVNAEKVVISGSAANIFSSKKDSLNMVSHGTPRRGPFHYRGPEAMLRRTVRGMLPWKKSRGQVAYKRLRVYVGKPKELEGHPYLPLTSAKLADPYRPHVTIGDLSKELLNWRK
jgi:large subunit ribosomal protein L13